MSTIGSMLNAGTNGMMTAQTGLAVRSNNATNVATPGYTRKTVTVQSLSPYGSGSRATGIRASVDTFVERRLGAATSQSGSAAANAESLRALDEVFADGPGSVGDALDAFQAALADVADDPGADAPRIVLLERAGQLTRAFQDASRALGAARTDTNARTVDAVRVLNGKLHEIDDLNGEIAGQRTTGGNPTDLEDRRALLVRDVAELLPVETFTDSSGRVSVMLGGSRALVDAANGVTELRTSTDASGNVRLERTTSGVVEDVGAFVTSGTIGGMLSARDGALATASSSLDALAQDVATAYNGVHGGGFGLDGSSGRMLFDTAGASPGAASRMRVSADVAGHPERLAAASTSASVPGDNRNALSLIDLSSANVAEGGTKTLGDAYAKLVALAGSAVRDADAAAEHASATTEQITALRDSVSGVSSDEEMVAIMQYQRAFEASMKVIQTADELLSSIINLKR